MRSYARLGAARQTIRTLKAAGALTARTCPKHGLIAHCVAALAVAVAYNRRLAEDQRTNAAARVAAQQTAAEPASPDAPEGAPAASHQDTTGMPDQPNDAPRVRDERIIVGLDLSPSEGPLSPSAPGREPLTGDGTHLGLPFGDETFAAGRA